MTEPLTSLWAAVSAAPYPKDAPYPSKQPGGWARRKLFSVDYNRGSFAGPDDVMPEGRRKLVHRFGSCACVTLQIDADSPYTGLLRTGGPGLLRLSDVGAAKTIQPSLALKLFGADGAGQNFLALGCGEPRTSHWLSTPLSNASKPADDLGGKLVERSFGKTARALGGKRLYGTYLPLHHLCGPPGDGAVVPDRLVLRATDTALGGLKESADWRVELEGLRAGTHLFDVYAAPDIASAETPLGRVVLDTTFVASEYGDTALFFRHDVGPT